MKTKILVLLLAAIFSTNTFAQKGKNVQTSATTENSSEQVTDSMCLIYISLFNEAAKNKQYADAIGPWTLAYNECPGANRVIYTRGREILQWKLSQAKDLTSYKEAFDELMAMYDKRIKYFGDDSRYPTPWILGVKALDYITYVKGDDLKKPAYEWLEQSINGLKENSELEVLRQFIMLSYNLYKANPEHAEKFIADYLKVNDLLETQIANPEYKYNELANQIKQGLDVLFAQSGAADCQMLDKMYASKVTQNSTNLEFLNNVLSFYNRIGCIQSDVYFSAALSAHKIQPSTESANALAEMSYKKKDYSGAIKFYEQATQLANNNKEKATYQYKIAQIYYGDLKNYSRAREYALKSLEFNPNNGSAYLMIGIMYANSNIYDDPVLQKSVYWAAVDKFIKAKQVDNDPKIIEEANKLIQTYINYFPSKEDIFFHPQLEEGKSFFVGGWIGESTICRASN